MSNISALVSIVLWSIVCHENLVITQVEKNCDRRKITKRRPFFRENDEGLVLKKNEDQVSATNV